MPRSRRQALHARSTVAVRQRDVPVRRGGRLWPPRGPARVLLASRHPVALEFAAQRLSHGQYAGYAVRELRATGGFARSDLWKQILADSLERPVGFTDTREGSAFGAALLGMEALGEVSVDDATALVEVVEVVEPSDG